MYQWSYKVGLETLRVEGKDSVLVFSVGREMAEVSLKDGDIAKVVVKNSSLEKILLRPSDAKHVVVGAGNTRRDVYHWLTPGGPTTTMRLGITKHLGAGTWSSLPHNFELNLEPGFEEVFFYLLQGGSKRAFQVGRGMWSNGEKVDAVWPVKNNQFSTIPMGYHPVVGEPGVVVSYVWVYLVKHKRWEKI